MQSTSWSSGHYVSGEFIAATKPIDIWIPIDIYNIIAHIKMKLENESRVCGVFIVWVVYVELAWIPITIYSWFPPLQNQLLFYMRIVVMVDCRFSLLSLEKQMQVLSKQ